MEVKYLSYTLNSIPLSPWSPLANDKTQITQKASMYDFIPSNELSFFLMNFFFLTKISTIILQTDIHTKYCRRHGKTKLR